MHAAEGHNSFSELTPIADLAVAIEHVGDCLDVSCCEGSADELTVLGLHVGARLSINLATSPQLAQECLIVAFGKDGCVTSVSCESYGVIVTDKRKCLDSSAIQCQCEFTNDKISNIPRIKGNKIIVATGQPVKVSNTSHSLTIGTYACKTYPKSARVD